ncbi:MFS transporter [Ramlibacter sp. Leaf400]|uniref:MFS transporter n=1 Tax=Ramlibacter sp. Leaf400 TaxID=1736365 RepID=UPI0006FF987D|nr:MFS transporter [Ramlibacter sp. Leaf400]KQT07594.1 MFS transporter [Ramlibacter sp. Leaf400]
MDSARPAVDALEAQRAAEAAPPRRILPVIVGAQFAGTSLWFAVNAVMPDLQGAWGLPPAAVGTLSSAVQLGFVAGTLVFALAMVADRFPPTRVFLACSLLGAAVNAAMLLADGSLPLLVALRFAVGFLLAGIYPVGMKIAAAWFRERLGAVLGVLIGALVLGTALPHGLRALATLGADGQVPWQAVVLAVSALAALGGIATAWWVPDRPAVPGARITPRALGAIWSDRRLRASVFGYFGHMWELYAFIVLVPAMAASRVAGTGAVSALSFWAIAAGFVGCVGGGLAVRRWGSAWVAQAQLSTSAACCLLAPLMLSAPMPLFVAWLLLWGATVAGDSPQFSALTGRNAPPAVVGSVLTFTNCIGFAISVVSIELFVAAAQARPLAQVLPWLALGPAAGLWMMRPLLRRRTDAPA